MALGTTQSDESFGFRPKQVGLKDLLIVGDLTVSSKSVAL